MLDVLPSEEKQLLKLLYIRGSIDSYLALILDIPENTFKTKLRRAREKSRKQWRWRGDYDMETWEQELKNDVNRSVPSIIDKRVEETQNNFLAKKQKRKSITPICGHDCPFDTFVLSLSSLPLQIP